MPDSVKISELATRAAVADDMVPAVDSTFSQTVRVSASSIAAIGGGPPADGTVTTSKMADNAVTAAKCAFTAPDRLFSRTAAGAGSGVEITCTPYARTLLAAPDGPTARAHLDALQTTNNPTFTGQVLVANGQSNIPSIAAASDTQTGIYFPQPDALAISANGQEVFRILSNGTIATRAIGDNTPRPQYRCVAWATLDGQAATGALATLGPDSWGLGYRYGLQGSIIGGPSSDADWQRTINYLTALEASRGLTLELPSGTFNDAYGKGTFPEYNRGTANRANYTTVNAGNWHWYWTGSAWAQRFNVYTIPWLGTIRLRSQTAKSFIRASEGITASRYEYLGAYTVFFATPMPDLNYVVLGGASENGFGYPGHVSVRDRQLTYCTVSVQESRGNYDASYANLAFFR